MDRSGRSQAPLSGTPIELLRAFLQQQRDTFLWKASGLDHTVMNRAHPPSTLTVAGLVKHMAFVESYWFSEVFVGERVIAPFDTADWDADLDWEFTSAPADTPADLFALYARACADADRVLDHALAIGGLDQLAVIKRKKDGGPISLGWVLLHMIEEYARHNGHLDLIRESIDGLTGE